MAPRSRKPFLCYDLGGTKLKAALIGPSGRILNQASVCVRQAHGYPGLLEDFKNLAAPFSSRDYSCVSVASAGPLHPAKGVLLDPTNFFTDHHSWGVVPLVQSLKRIFKKPVYLENDAAAAVMAEHWKGGHGRVQNLIAITLGTGVGIGVIANGELVRAGRGLHPEASHAPINADDRDRPCACGAYGCIEAYLGGSHFARNLGRQMGRRLTGKDCLDLVRAGDKQAQKAFQEYGVSLARAIRVLSVLFAPEVVVLSGGFSHASPYFLKTAEEHLPGLMKRYREGIDLLPKLKISKLQDDAGVLGAACVALRRVPQK